MVQETRLYDPDKDETRSMRSKEEANDYRYFPCPDLLPVHLSDELLQQIRDNLPELPEAKAQRFVSEYGITQYDASVITADGDIAAYFEATARTSGNGKLSANWVMAAVSAWLNEHDGTVADCPVQPDRLPRWFSESPMTR